MHKHMTIKFEQSRIHAIAFPQKIKVCVMFCLVLIHEIYLCVLC